ncbi:hypothetical protein [Vampirovibrio sp.]|uniref:hypothetical protein n=1 Tax=Vampirovibrio sp. TaxID=2717857 RepID=UPI00359381C4
MDEYGKKNGHSPAVVTGKPLELGGSLGRKEATGRGAFFIIREFYKQQGEALAGKTVAVQGFGNVGFYKKINREMPKHLALHLQL